MIFSPFFNPLLQHRFLFGTQRFIRSRGGHHHFGIGRNDAFHQRAFVRSTGNDCFQCDRRISLIQPQIRLPREFVESVTGKTLVRQNRANIAIKIDLCIFSDDHHTQDVRSHTNNGLIERHFASTRFFGFPSEFSIPLDYRHFQFDKRVRHPWNASRKITVRIFAVYVCVLRSSH